MVPITGTHIAAGSSSCWEVKAKLIWPGQSILHDLQFHVNSVRNVCSNFQGDLSYVSGMQF